MASLLDGLHDSRFQSDTPKSLPWRRDVLVGIRPRAARVPRPPALERKGSAYPTPILILVFDEGQGLSTQAQQYKRICCVMPSSALYGRALELQARYHYSFYDSLILAAALESGCTRVLSEDLQDCQRIEGLTIENPFKD